jgi:hypothetical protein
VWLLLIKARVWTGHKGLAVVLLLLLLLARACHVAAAALR